MNDKTTDKELKEAEEYDSYFFYTCPICGYECGEWDDCGCGSEVNLPKD